MVAQRRIGNSPTPTPSHQGMAGGDGSHRGTIYRGYQDIRQRAESADKKPCTEAEPADDAYRNSKKDERFRKGASYTGSYILLTPTHPFSIIQGARRPVKQEISAFFIILSPIHNASFIKKMYLCTRNYELIALFQTYKTIN
jgi:hypothetical protein